jgi:hypothetical protein
VTPEVSPVAVIEYGTLMAPDPRSVPPAAGTRVPNTSSHDPGFVALMRNHPVVCSPFGVPEPLSDADDVVIEVAADVVAVGAAANTRNEVRNTSTNAAARRT